MYEEDWSLDDPCYIYHGKIVPYDFPYICILVQGRPRHYKDSRYPQMERGKRLESGQGYPRMSHSVLSGHTVLPHHTRLSHYIPSDPTRLMVLIMVLEQVKKVRLPLIKISCIYHAF